jgi:hypothetical protein
MREKLAELADASVDAIVTDPPYHLTTGKKGGSGMASLNVDSPYGRSRIGTGFMGMKWDGGDVAMQADVGAPAARGEARRAPAGLRRLPHLPSRVVRRRGRRLGDPRHDAVAARRGLPEVEQSGRRMGGLGHGAEAGLRADPDGPQAADRFGAENLQAHGVGALNIDACRVRVTARSTASVKGNKAP